MELQDTGNPELDTDPQRCPVNAMLDRLIKRRIVEAMIYAFPNPSSECTLTGQKVGDFIRNSLNEAWDNADKLRTAVLTPLPPRNLSSCGFCRYEEADGELLEQCAKCKERDANH